MIPAVFASSAGIRQGKLRCQAMWPESGRRFHQVCMFFSWSKQRSESFGNQGIEIGQFIEFALYLESLYVFESFHVLMLGGIIVGTAKSFVKQYGGRFIEILDSAYSMLQMGCCHVIIWIKPFHQKSGLEEISGGLVCRRHASLLCGDQMA